MTRLWVFYGFYHRAKGLAPGLAMRCAWVLRREVLRLEREGL